MVFTSLAGLAGGLLGALQGGAVGSVRGLAATWLLGALIWWWELRAAMRESSLLQVSDDRAGQDQESAMASSRSVISPGQAASATSLVVNGVNGQRERATPAASSTSAAWTAVVTSDRTYYDRMRLSVALSGASGVVPGPFLAFPNFDDQRRFHLNGSQMRIGRQSATRNLDLEIDLAGPPADPGISRLHAILVAAPDGDWAVLDPGSANGTLVNGRRIAVGDLVPLQHGDRINLGAWTVITVRRG